MTAERAFTERISPWIFDLGVSRRFGSRTFTHLKVSYFSRVNPYLIISEAISIVSGFSTDFNYMDNRQFEDLFPYYRNMSCLDIYNLRDPKDYLGLFGPIQNNTENNYLQINLVFGFNYFFPRI